jgi:formylmethanofuran dehydrogenase subunit A
MVEPGRTLALNLIDPTNHWVGPIALQLDQKGAVQARRPLSRGDGLPWAVPAGVDMHTHILSEGVHLARVIAGTERVPALDEVAARYHQVGYTTAVDAAVMPDDAPLVRQWVQSLSGLDYGFLVLGAHHPLVIEQIQKKSLSGLSAVLEELVHTTGALGVKVVNPSGAGRQPLADLNQPGPYGFSPAEHLARMAEAVSTLKLVHPLHIHGLDLGVPGNVQTTLEMLKVLDGLPIHLAHLQFYCYAAHPEGGMASAAEPIAQWINDHPEVSCDLGQVVFGPTVTLSNDLALQDRLKKAHGNRSTVVEHDHGGLAAVPYTYRLQNAVNAVQWAVGLELALMIQNPWQVFLSTDHPNGGAFWHYPQIVSWLTERSARQNVLNALPKAVRRRMQLGELEREYSDAEVVVSASAGPAKRLGLEQKGHLGTGALADLAVYPSADGRLHWDRPQAVMRRGQWVLQDGKPTNAADRRARLWCARGSKTVEEGDPNG